MKPKRKLTKIFSLMLSGVSLVSIILIGALWISFESNRSEQDIRKIRSDYLASHKETISLETNRICDYMEARRQSSEIRFLKAIRERAYEAYRITEAAYQAAGPEAESRQTQDLILASLRAVSFNDGRRQYSVLNLAGDNLLRAEDAIPAEVRENFSEVVASLDQGQSGHFPSHPFPGATTALAGTHIPYL